MKSLKTVQGLAKAGRILSTIVFICSIVAGALCAIGALLTGIIGGGMVDFVNRYLVKFDGGAVALTADYMLTALICGVIICAAEAVLSKFAINYFKRELKDGTPFTFGGAAELKRLGLLAIFIPIGAYAAAGVFYGIMKLTHPDLAEINCSGALTILTGALLLAGSCLCKLGAEQAEGKAAPEAAETPEQPLRPVPPEL